MQSAAGGTVTGGHEVISVQVPGTVIIVSGGTVAVDEGMGVLTTVVHGCVQSDVGGIVVALQDDVVHGYPVVTVESGGTDPGGIGVSTVVVHGCVQSDVGGIIVALQDDVVHGYPVVTVKSGGPHVVEVLFEF